MPLLLVAACSSSGSSSSSSSPGTTAASASGQCPYTFAVITHGDNGSFWSVVYKGAKDAASALGCKLSEVYGSQQQGQAEPDDNAENAQIQDAINAHVNGIAVSDHDPSLMNTTIAKAVAAGIPVVMLNAGCDPADLAATHAITCVGQPEQISRPAGRRPVQERGDDQRPVRHPPVGPEPPRPLQRHRAGARRRVDLPHRHPAEDRACVHRADLVHAQRGQ